MNPVPSLNPKPNLSAIALAGGLSQRMGQDKALLTINGIPLLQRICDIARQCADPVYVVTPWKERYCDRISNVRWIEEAAYAEGQPNGSLIGFMQGLAQVETEWVLLLACDLPQLDAGILQEGAASLSKIDQDVAALLPKNPEGWWEPLCGFYRRDRLPHLQDYVQQGGRSFQKWLAQQSVRQLDLVDSTMLLNCNTPADWQIVRSRSTKPTCLTDKTQDT
jgi:molybdenum cofactor guanylyltransferase